MVIETKKTLLECNNIVNDILRYCTILHYIISYNDTLIIHCQQEIYH